MRGDVLLDGLRGLIDDLFAVISGAVVARTRSKTLGGGTEPRSHLLAESNQMTGLGLSGRGMPTGSRAGTPALQSERPAACATVLGNSLLHKDLGQGFCRRRP